MSNIATLPQAKHLIEMFETLESGELQALFASGLLTDLRRCATELDPTKVDRIHYRRVLGLEPTVFRTRMGDSENTDQIMATLGFLFNSSINQRNFSLKPSNAPWEDEIEIVDPGTDFSEEAGLQILKDKGLKRPTYEHGIRFAWQHGKATASVKKPFVVFPHEAYKGFDGSPYVIALNRHPERHALRLLGLKLGFGKLCVLAGVRPRK